MENVVSYHENEGKVVKGKPTLLFNVFLIFGALLSFVLYESFRLVKEPSTPTVMGNVEFLVVILCSLMVSSFIIFLGHKYFDVHLNVPIAVIMSILFVGNMIAIILFPNVWTDPAGNELLLKNDAKFFYIAAYACELLFMYLFLGMGPQVQKGEGGLSFVLEFVILVTFVAIIYSYIVEGYKYVAYFKALFAGDPTPYRDNIRSFTYNVNPYGALLFFGGAAELCYHQRDRKLWRLIIALFFYVNCAIIQSKTTIISFTFLLGLYLLLDGFLLMKHGKKTKGLIMIGFVGGGILLTLILFVFPFSPFHSMLRELSETYVTGPSNTFKARERIWEQIGGVITSNPLFLLFGVGNTNFFYVFRFVMGGGAPTGAGHNGFVEVFGRGGLVACIAYALFIAYYIYIFIKLIKKHHTRRYWFYVIFFFAFMLRAVAESDAFLLPDWNGILGCVFCIFPVFSAYFSDKPEYQELTFGGRELGTFVYHGIPSVLSTLGFALFSWGLSTGRLYLTLIGLPLQLVAYLWLGVKSNRPNAIFITLGILTALDTYMFVLQYVAFAYCQVDVIFMTHVLMFNFLGVGLVSSCYLIELLPIKCALESRDIVETKYQYNRW